MSSFDQAVALSPTASRLREAGTRWLRCDLHVHTPFDGEKKFGENIRAASEVLKRTLW